MKNQHLTLNQSTYSSFLSEILKHGRQSVTRTCRKNDIEAELGATLDFLYVCRTINRMSFYFYICHTEYWKVVHTIAQTPSIHQNARWRDSVDNVLYSHNTLSSDPNCSHAYRIHVAKSDSLVLTSLTTASREHNPLFHSIECNLQVTHHDLPIPKPPTHSTYTSCLLIISFNWFG